MIGLAGPAVGYAVGAAGYLLALLLLAVVPAAPPPAGLSAGLVAAEGQLDGGGGGSRQNGAEQEQARGAAGGGGGGVWIELLRNKEFCGVILVTIVGNLCFWGHIPFIQVDSRVSILPPLLPCSSRILTGLPRRCLRVTLGLPPRQPACSPPRWGEIALVDPPPQSG